MAIGRFYGGIAALVWSPETDRYLLLRRSAEKDYAAGVWECVTGRVDQGEGFEDALLREVTRRAGGCGADRADSSARHISTAGHPTRRTR